MSGENSTNNIESNIKSNVEYNIAHKISKIINKFYNETDLTKAVNNLLKDICKLFQISKVSGFLKGHENKYTPILMYCLEDNLNNQAECHWSEIDAYLTAEIFLNIEDTFKEDPFISLFKGNRFLFIDDSNDLDKVKEALKEIDYPLGKDDIKDDIKDDTKDDTKDDIKDDTKDDTKDEINNIIIHREAKSPKSDIDISKIYNKTISNNISQFFAFNMSHKYFFCYFIFEIHKNNSLDANKIDCITSICQSIIHRVEQFQKQKDLENDVLVTRAIIQNEELPIAVVEKNSYTILEHNQLYNQILPNIKDGKTCYTLFNKIKPCDDCCINNSQLLQNLHSNGKHWIKKSVPVKFVNNIEAHVIYAKDTNDYIEQLDGIDILTGSLSMKGLQEYYNNNIKKDLYAYALATFDIDKFKYINNVMGYDGGNKILIQISETIKNFVKEQEAFCRINEDKFAVLIKYSNIKDIEDRFSDLNKRFQEMQEKFFPTQKVTIIGGVCIVDKSIELNILMDMANTARKNAKGSYNNKINFYDETLKQKVISEKLIEEKMFLAMENNEFIPYFQPKFYIQNKKLYGAEALVRWKTSDGKMIFPNEFIPIFEKNGYITTLDFAIYKQVIKYIRKCLDNNINICPISVNVSRAHINDKNFLKKFIALLEKYNVPRNLLELEITESVFVEDQSILKNFIDSLKSENLKISIDDFGTAYSSLNILKELNIDILKIDKEFLYNLDNFNISKNSSKVSEVSEISEVVISSSKDEIVIKHIINMAKELNFEVICEGIETEEQISMLKSIGCQLGQGYLFAKPLPVEEFEKLLN